MIERLNDKQYVTLSKPCLDFINILKNYKKDYSTGISVAEIGVGMGATAVEIVKVLSPNDSYYFFSYDEDVKELCEDLRQLKYCKCQLFPFGNSRKTYDSYVWNLAKILSDNYDEKNNIRFDLVYLDGAHTLFHDGLACVLLKELVKPNGIIVFDDLKWTYFSSPVVNPSIYPKTAELFTDEQIREAQVSLVTKLFMEHDKGWQRISINQYRGAYKKLPT